MSHRPPSPPVLRGRDRERSRDILHRDAGVGGRALGAQQPLHGCRCALPCFAASRTGYPRKLAPQVVAEVIAKHGAELQLGNTLKRDWGLAILRSGSGANARAAFLDFDSGGRHAHADGMNIGLFAKGLDLTDGARAWLGRVGYDPVYGARPLKRAVQKYLQDPLADAILRGEIMDGETVHIEEGDGGLKLGTEGAGGRERAA